MENVSSKLKKFPYLFLLMLFCSLTLWAQQGKTVKGVVLDGNGDPVIGASVVVKGSTAVGTITDLDGNFTLNVPDEKSTLVFSFIGMTTQEQRVPKGGFLRVTLEDDTEMLDEVVVVGYGQQKKASVVGAITQTTGKVLERAAGISDIGAALTGNLPGVITVQGSGMPGEEEPQITIRGASSWNNSDPLVLVDGIERPMSSVDISSVESISVLKDASATAVYGVKGANGVILITTKRGQEGGAKIDVGFNTTLKAPSKLPNKLDSYDALMARNVALEHELVLTPDESWAYIRPQAFIENYRNQTTVEQRERYPNVDWQKALFKDTAISYNANLNISGGSEFVKYFASADYVHEGDLFRVYDNGRGYDSGYGYDRINVRSNLDFNITKTTVFKVNLAGSTGIRKSPWNNTGASEWSIGQQWAGAYNIAPDVFLPVYSDGSWGYYPNITNVTNSAANLSLGGTNESTTTRINTDFTLEQDLSFITKGLSARALISWDNVFVETSRGINDLNNDAQYKWINPDTGEVSYKNTYDANNKFDWMQGVNWSTADGAVSDGETVRNLYYQIQLNWARTFGKHDLTAMGVFSRQEEAKGSVMPIYREDWAFRVTYNYADKYFIEYNGAYNGSDKFSKENRFAYFNSGAIGWMISEEKFMKFSKKWLDMLKVRASYGEIGDDNVFGDRFNSANRWLYMNQWAYGGNAYMDLNQGTSVYTWFRESAIGNPDVKWETVKKFNFGVDYSFLNGLLAGTIEVFRDERTDILVTGSDRSVPAFFGGTPPTANIGRVKTRGYELELRLNKVFPNQMRLWGNFNMTHAENKVLEKDDQPLRPSYQKAAGYAIGQYTSYIDNGFIQNLDQLYGSPAHDTNDSQRLVGDYYIVDFNGDGIIDNKDSAPYGYSSTPQNTYNATIGFEWKGFSAFVQFYGVTNVTRDVSLTSFGSKLNTVYDTGTWWSKDEANPEVIIPRFASSTNNYTYGTQYLYDGSYIRLKNAEIAYTFNGGWIHKLGIRNLKIYLNGNNLWLWTRMPDDREANLSGAGYLGAYPTVRRYNLGIKFTL